MAAPTPTARQNPRTGALQIPEGFHAHITFSLHPDLAVWERDLVPPEMDGGAPINNTTQFNTRFKTCRLRTLVEMKPFKVTGGYAPDELPTLRDMINVEQTITWTYPDGSTECFYGGLIKATPKDMKEADFPLIDLEVAVTNWDPVNHVEAGPAFNLVAGT